MCLIGKYVVFYNDLNTKMGRFGYIFPFSPNAKKHSMLFSFDSHVKICLQF